MPWCQRGAVPSAGAWRRSGVWRPAQGQAMLSAACVQPPRAVGTGPGEWGSAALWAAAACSRQAMLSRARRRGSVHSSAPWLPAAQGPPACQALRRPGQAVPPLRLHCLAALHAVLRALPARQAASQRAGGALSASARVKGFAIAKCGCRLERRTADLAALMLSCLRT